MMNSQSARSKEIEEMKDSEGILMCFRCQRAIKAVDRENDKLTKQLNLLDMIPRDEAYGNKAEQLGEAQQQQ
jgi:hypothetical protein